MRRVGDIPMVKIEYSEKKEHNRKEKAFSIVIKKEEKDKKNSLTLYNVLNFGLKLYRFIRRFKLVLMVLMFLFKLIVQLF